MKVAINVTHSMFQIEKKTDKENPREKLVSLRLFHVRLRTKKSKPI